MRNPADRLRSKNARVFLNGVLVPMCVMANEEAGVIKRYATNEQGQIIAPLQMIVEFGSVRIEQPNT